MKERKTLFVNLFGSPSSDKSHTAARLYGNCREWEAELVREYAKDLVWEGRTVEFEDQMTIIGKQIKRCNAVNGKVDVVFTGSPILLGAEYSKDYLLCETIKQAHDKYWSINFFLKRAKPYNPNGRFQTEEESNQIAEEIKQMLTKYEIPFIELDADGTQDEKIMWYVNKWLKTAHSSGCENSLGE